MAAGQIGQDHGIRGFGARKVPPHVAAGLERFRLEEGDLVCVRCGELGRVAQVGAEHEGWLTGTSCLRIRVKERTALRPRHLLQVLARRETVRWLVARSPRSVIASLRTRTLLDLPVVLPPTAEQEAILAVLASLDAEEAVHRRVAEETARLRSGLAERLLDGEFTVTTGDLRASGRLPAGPPVFGGAGEGRWTVILGG
ncbi:type I restriction modification DNA specificity protein [Actinocorallia herbida]|uniref:Type I restriction modification DNA specificity protein n=1 Tax=Actinocorallia herbida TaxID=58109 RepID=A0A3N1CTH2_9ACTN|nr:type I restriction modification DNA specificity protein [Actinocorallia herbida]